MKRSDRNYSPTDIIDLLHTRPSTREFSERVADLALSPSLTNKILAHLDIGISSRPTTIPAVSLSETDEKELALEVLITRHRFTELIVGDRGFRQAALTVIQNIYLFRNRKIFFGCDFTSTELERQEALLLLSGPGKHVALSKTFQHLIIARIWNRITGGHVNISTSSLAFETLHAQVEKLNTLRNVYILLSTGLVHALARKTSRVYRQSLPYEDAVQVGCFGIARAAYRYHPSCGVRFSTYAANWVRKEIQRQALAGRLVRISSNIVEQYAQALKTEDKATIGKLSPVIGDAPALSTLTEYRSADVTEQSMKATPADIVEDRQMVELLHDLVDTVLQEKSSDIIKRRFGLPPYLKEQSVIEISRVYSVSRSSIYQLEQRALKTIADHLRKHSLNPA